MVLKGSRTIGLLPTSGIWRRLDEQNGAVDEPVAQGLDSLKRHDRPSFAICGAPLRVRCLHARIRLNAMILNTC